MKKNWLCFVKETPAVASLELPGGMEKAFPGSRMKIALKMAVSAGLRESTALPS